MTKTRFMRGLCALAAVAAVGLASCDAPDYSDSAAEAALRLSDGKDYWADMSAADRALVAAAQTTSVAAVKSGSFMRGFDASMVSALEDAGIVYYNESGMPQDIFAILAASGVNWVRLRIWVDPVNDPTDKDDWDSNGSNDLRRTLKMARRVKAQGLKFLLDFQYSDRWTDPTHQAIPAAWDSISTVSDMAAQVKSYTKEVLVALKAAGCAPDMVQIGNEITGGMLLTGTNSGTVAGSGANLTAYLTAASEAVREVLPKSTGCKIMIHAERAKLASNKANNLFVAVKTVDYDVMGLSWYPFYGGDHGTLQDLKATVEDYIANAGGKYGAAHEVVIAENGCTWNMWNDDEDWLFDSKDDMVWWTSGNNTMLTTLVDGNGGLLAGMDSITTADTGNSPAFDASVKNQALEIRAVIDTVAQAGATGYFYWGGEWVSWGKGTAGAGRIYSNHENQALFGLDHKVLPSMKVLGAH